MAKQYLWYVVILCVLKILSNQFGVNLGMDYEGNEAMSTPIVLVGSLGILAICEAIERR